jgi:hypothetical protein
LGAGSRCERGKRDRSDGKQQRPNLPHAFLPFWENHAAHRPQRAGSIARCTDSSGKVCPTRAAASDAERLVRFRRPQITVGGARVEGR